MMIINFYKYLSSKYVVYNNFLYAKRNVRYFIHWSNILYVLIIDNYEYLWIL